MAFHTSKVVPAFDFTRAAALSLTKRFQLCHKRAFALVKANGYQRISAFPCVPDGATESEIQSFENRLRVSLPDEYRQFLTVCRYLKMDDGLEVGGLKHEGVLEIGGVKHEGVYVTEVPWVSTEHRPKSTYLVFANYWRYADGDQLMFDMSEPSHPVIPYLHEHGPLFEFYAPTFSLALWRLVHELDS